MKLPSYILAGLATITLLVFSRQACADLIFTINTTNQTYNFTGSTVVTPEFTDEVTGMFAQPAQYRAGLSGVGGVLDMEHQSISLNGIDITSVNTTPPPLPAVRESSVTLTIFEDMMAPGDITGVGFESAFRQQTNDPGDVTFTGNGMTYSYSALSPEAQAFLATGPSFSTSVTGNTTSGSFSVTVLSITAIPEPTSLALLSVGALGLLTRRRRSS